MQKYDNRTKQTLLHRHNLKLKLVIQSILVGIITGMLIVAYRLILTQTGKITYYVIDYSKQSTIYAVMWFAVLIIIAIIINYMMHKVPLIKGSGIPQVEGFLARKMDMSWAKVLICKFTGGILAIGSGLSLGREGPSIQLGAAVGKGISELFNRKKLEEKFLVTGGASAGLAAAFNAPLAGVMFSLEELHKNFSPVVLITALTASVTADFVAKSFIGLNSAFDFTGLKPLPLNYYPYILILGIIVGVFGAFYNSTLLKTQKYYNKKTWIPSKYKKFIPFVFAGILMFIIPDVLGGGHALVEKLSVGNYTIKFLLVLLCIKFIFSMVSYGSGAPGGIFLPLLVLGALTGNIYADILHMYFGFNEIFVQNMIILAMAGYFTAIVRAPITGCILVSEMSGSLTHLLSLAFISIIAYIVAELLNSEPIYESLLEVMIRNKSHKYKSDADTKVIIENVVCLGSRAEGKMIREIDWPEKCLIVGVKRGNTELIPKGETILQIGDYLITLTDEIIASVASTELSKITEVSFEGKN